MTSRGATDHDWGCTGVWLLWSGGGTVEFVGRSVCEEREGGEKGEGIQNRACVSVLVGTYFGLCR